MQRVWRSRNLFQYIALKSSDRNEDTEMYSNRLPIQSCRIVSGDLCLCGLGKSNASYSGCSITVPIAPVRAEPSHPVPPQEACSQTPKSPIERCSYGHETPFGWQNEQSGFGDFGVCLQLRNGQYTQCIATWTPGYFRNLHRTFRSCMFPGCQSSKAW
jgi:hypothetical protein